MRAHFEGSLEIAVTMVISKAWTAQYRLRRVLINSCIRHMLRPLAIRRRAIVESYHLGIARQAHEKPYREFDCPLVTITIATFNRADLLIERAINSVINQTYQNFEIVIVGDCCTDNTERSIKQLNEPRIRFINLPKRGEYPQDKRYRWMVAGTVPINRALDEARGLWIAHLDDDDVFETTHIEQSLEYAYKHNLEFVYGKRRIERSPGMWEITGSQGAIAHSAVVFRSYLKLFRFEISAWRLRLAVDHHIWLRMEHAGVRMGFLDKLSFHAPLRPGTTAHHYESEDTLSSLPPR